MQQHDTPNSDGRYIPPPAHCYAAWPHYRGYLGTMYLSGYPGTAEIAAAFDAEDRAREAASEFVQGIRELYARLEKQLNGGPTNGH